MAIEKEQAVAPVNRVYTAFLHGNACGRFLGRRDCYDIRTARGIDVEESAHLYFALECSSRDPELGK